MGALERAEQILAPPIRVGWTTSPGPAQSQCSRQGGWEPLNDVANLVRFLLSDQGQWINGQLLHSNESIPEGPVSRADSGIPLALLTWTCQRLPRRSTRTASCT
jgi:NAD(P)-dependent dehydrogenase (short-subunit alcohol dehydrogenase family)